MEDVLLDRKCGSVGDSLAMSYIIRIEGHMHRYNSTTTSWREPPEGWIEMMTLTMREAR